jgi:hypothetical protein
MSVRASTPFPRACSGDMYCEVPITIPASVWTSARVIASVSVPSFWNEGINQFRQTEVEDFHVTILANHHVLRLDVAMDDAGRRAPLQARR